MLFRCLETNTFSGYCESLPFTALCLHATKFSMDNHMLLQLAGSCYHTKNLLVDFSDNIADCGQQLTAKNYLTKGTCSAD